MVESSIFNVQTFRSAFKDQGWYVSLGRRNVVEVILSVIAEHIPETEALDLSRNRLPFQYLEKFKKALPNLKILFFKSNNVSA
jgi:hypothetical protein